MSVPRQGSQHPAADLAEYWERASCGTRHTTHKKHSREYYEEIEWYRYQHEPFIHSFAQFTRWHGKDVLEVGVGAGTDFTLFLRAGARASGVDLSVEGIENTRARLRLEGLQAEDLRVCNAEKLPYENESFDLVYSWGVVHHAENSQQILSEMFRVTRPGGEIKVMVYNIRSLHAWYLCFRHALWRGRGRRWALANYQESPGTRGYSTREITAMLTSHAHTKLRFHFWDQRIRCAARWRRTRSVMRRLAPPTMRWFMAFELRKQC
jgi:SAM-dependent methyltransferase